MHKAMILLPVLLLGGCNVAFGQGSHEQAARDFQVGAFQKINAAGSAEVTVRVGGAPSVHAEGDKKALDELDIQVVNGSLNIGRKSSGGWNFGWGHHRRIRITVTVPSLAGASLAGSGDIHIDKVGGPSFEGSVAGSGDIAVDHLEVGEAHFSIAGSGDVKAAGKVGRANLSTAGSGDMRTGGLEAGTATISIMGSGGAQLRVTQSADITIMGSGDVHVAGTTNCQIHKAGSGDVHCG